MRGCCLTSSSSAITSPVTAARRASATRGRSTAQIEDAVTKNDIVGAAVLSGNRNFEARIHQAIRANFLMSPPLVVAFGLAGTVNIDMSKDPLGTGKDGKPVYLREHHISLCRQHRPHLVGETRRSAVCGMYGHALESRESG